MSEKKSRSPGQPVVFLDLHYVQRTIAVGDDELRVEGGRVTATRAVHIKALDALYGLKREGK